MQTGSTALIATNEALQQQIDAVTRERDALKAALQKAVACYGKPGGPWNVPSEPGSWIEQARTALGEGR